MMQEIEESCLIGGLEHSYEFVLSDAGASHWECVFCPSVITELEDCQL